MPGPLCAVFGLCANALIVYVFLARLQCTRSHLFYLCVLAVFDMIVELCYMAVFSVQMLAEHLGDEWLWWLWHEYVIGESTTTTVVDVPAAMAALGQTAITGAAFMMVAASFERYLVITHWAMNDLTTVQRSSIVLVVIVVACLAKVV